MTHVLIAFKQSHQDDGMHIAFTPEQAASTILQIQILTKASQPSGVGPLPYAMPVPITPSYIQSPVLVYDNRTDAFITCKNIDEYNAFINELNDVNNG